MSGSQNDFEFGQWILVLVEVVMQNCVISIYRTETHPQPPHKFYNFKAVSKSSYVNKEILSSFSNFFLLL